VELDELKKAIAETIKTLEGYRDGIKHYDRLCWCAEYIKERFTELGFSVENDDFQYNDRWYSNIIATAETLERPSQWILVGAHYDAVAGSPGADDNASGVAVMLEVARIIGPRRSLKFVAFSLEEPQQSSFEFLIGSKHFVQKMVSQGHTYEAVFVLESVGFISHETGSQLLPPFVDAPDTGDFIGLIGNKKALDLMNTFKAMATRYVPQLKVVTYKAPLRGYMVPETRFSDHAPFWDAGFPAVMITDTAMFRNPYYHTEYDRMEFLSLDFMAQITVALVKTLESLLQ